MKLLILHGPNMNLFGVRSAQKGEKLTLDKINKHIRRYIRDKNIEIKIIQTHSENKIVSYLHRNRKKFVGMIITPGSWGKSAFTLDETLSLINLKYVSIKVSNTEAHNILQGEKSLYNENIFTSFEDAINSF